MRARRQRRSRWGGAVVEMAVVAPLFVLFILGQIESARLGMVAQLLTTAARDGCRIAVIDGKTNADVTNQIAADLNLAGITGVTTVQTPTDCTTVRATDTPNTITVTLSVPYSRVGWLPTPYFLNSATITASATMSSERP
jgi:Flp pilus assembly protein TadG